MSSEEDIKYSYIGEGLRDLVQQQRSDEHGNDRPISVWNSIAPQLEQMPPRPVVALWLEKWFEVVRTSLSQLISPPVAATAAVALFAFVYFGVSRGGDVVEDGGFSVASLSEHESKISESEIIKDLTLVGLGAASRDASDSVKWVSPFEKMREEVAVNLSRRASRDNRSAFPYQQLARQVGAGYNLSGGLRVGGADIEWIRSRSAVKIVPAVSQEKPPVIWISRR